jgi:hypothetical protein
LYYFKEQHRYDPHANHTLLIGPYDDSMTQAGVQPVLRGYTVDRAALVDLRDLRYQWFDSVLKGAPTPALLKDRVNFEVMGANEWRHAPSIEAMGNGTLKLYLDPTSVGASHLLTQRGSQGKLEGHDKSQNKGKSAKAKAKAKAKEAAQARQAEREFVDQSVNLADRGDVNSNWLPSDIASHIVEVRNATNYVSQPLPKAIEVQGAWSGKLDLTINKMDVDLRVAAYELLPSGDYVQLFEPYIFRASYAQNRVHRHLLKAGERQTISFKLERLTSRKLQAGSRLVLVLGVNKRPDQEINYGSGEDVSAESLADDDDKLPVKIRWYGDSYIDVPVRR